MEAGTPDLVKLEDLEASRQLTGRKHILSLLVENKPGVLARIAGLFSRRGFNIDTLAVGPTEDPDTSRITITLDGAGRNGVCPYYHQVNAAVESRAEIMQFAEIDEGKIVDVSRRSLTIEVTGSQDKIDSFERMIRPHGLIEMARTGEVAITKSRPEH